jgi:hypothetical protein
VTAENSGTGGHYCGSTSQTMVFLSLCIDTGTRDCRPSPSSLANGKPETDNSK